MDSVATGKKVEILKIILSNFNSKNDTEKLAALLTVPKLIDASEISNDELESVFKEVGFSFINRLLRSRHVPEGCSEHAYKAISLGILKNFSYLHALAEDENMLKNITLFSEILAEATSKKTSNEDEAKMLIYDCLEIMMNLSKTSEGCERLINKEVVLVLGDYITNLYYGWQKAFEILKFMIKHSSFMSSTCSLQKFPRIMKIIAQKIFIPVPEVFEVLRHVSDVLGCCDKELLSIINLDELWPVLMDGLNGMLKSKLNPNERQTAIDASCKLISLLGFNFFMKTKESEEFFFLVVQLSSIELQVSLHAIFDQKDPDKLQFYTLCCNIMEVSMQHCVAGGGDKVERLQDMIFELMASVLQYFKSIFAGKVDEEEVTPYCCMLLRLSCAFISFEEFALDEDVLSTLPAFLSIFDALFKNTWQKKMAAKSCKTECKCKFQSSSRRLECITAAICRTSTVDRPESIAGESEKAAVEEVVASGRCEHDLHLLGMFLPGLESLSHLSEAREMVLERDTLEVLLRYFSFLCRLETSDECSHKSYTSCLNSLCNVFCNFVYPDEEFCQEPCFHEICIAILHALVNADFCFVGKGEVSDLVLSLQTVCVILLQKLNLYREFDENCIKKFQQSVEATLQKASTLPQCDPECVRLLKYEVEKCKTIL